MQGVQYAKKFVLENGPIVMEADTYRYHGHSMSDPGSTYRTRDEISSMRQLRDPVEHVRKLLTDNNLMESSELKKLEKVNICKFIALMHCIQDAPASKSQHDDACRQDQWLPVSEANHSNLCIDHSCLPGAFHQQCVLGV